MNTTFKFLTFTLLLLATACGGTTTTEDGSVPDGNITMDGGVDADVDATVDGGPSEDGGQTDAGPVVDYNTCILQDSDSEVRVFTVTTITDQGEGRDHNNLSDIIQPTCDFEGLDGLDNGWSHYTQAAASSYPLMPGDTNYFPIDINHLMQDSVTSGGSVSGTKTVITVTVSHITAAQNDDCLQVNLDITGNGPMSHLTATGRMVDGRVETMTSFKNVGVPVNTVPFGFVNSATWNQDHSEICTVGAPCGESVFTINLRNVAVDMVLSTNHEDMEGEITGFVYTDVVGQASMKETLEDFIMNLNINNVHTNVKSAGQAATKFAGDLYVLNGEVGSDSCIGDFMPLDPVRNGNAISVAWAITNL